MKTSFARGAGVLCHISSLPNPYGIGSLGKEAYKFADQLHKNHVKYWQILPLVQTGFGDSPYQSVCCNSGNPYFIDLEDLCQRGLLEKDELEQAKVPYGEVDYATLYQTRYPLLRLAYERFNINDKDFVAFMQKGEFEDYALYMSLKAVYKVPFYDLPDAYKYKENLAMFDFRNAVFKKEYCFYLFLQFIFFEQWNKLKKYVNSLGISIIGDIPLYVAYDSADVWSHPELFCLDEELKPLDVAGVPPDYFSQTGQLWGNPLYNWDALKATSYAWWVERVASAAKMYDIIRIDHFRGLDRYYAIPADAENAVVGEWRHGPKLALFQAIQKRLGSLPIIAEDLGVMDNGVISLRDVTGLPGMKILLFAFDGNPDNDYLPANTQENSVTYTGTHDNDTVLGYLQSLTEEQFTAFKKQLREVLKGEGVVYPLVDRLDCTRAMVLCALANESCLSIIPVQDIMALDNHYRMNTPSTSGVNWKFRMQDFPTRLQWAVFKRAIDKTNR